MNDIEWLELAAKAAGYKWRINPFLGYFEIQGLCPPDGGDGWVIWNPFLDDGDTFRLAVKLNLEINIGTKFTLVISKPLEKGKRVMVEHLSDPIEATRAAIIRAAAEIGRNMP